MLRLWKEEVWLVPRCDESVTRPLTVLTVSRLELMLPGLREAYSPGSKLSLAANAGTLSATTWLVRLMPTSLNISMRRRAVGVHVVFHFPASLSKVLELPVHLIA